MSTEFEFYYERDGQRTLIERATLPEVADIADLYIGVQVYEYSGGGTTRFDNLRLGAVPEPPSHASLLLLALLLVGLRWRK